jgi:uroporphyrin-3 C-methyltransferase
MTPETPAPETAVKPAKQPYRWLSLPVVAAVAALILAGVGWLTTYQQIGALQEQLAKRLSAFETRNNESRILAGQAQESMRELQVKVGVLEQKLAESQNQQVALEAMYQELAKGRDEASLAEIEQLVFSASQQLQIAGNVKAALISLESAESRLQHIDKPQFLSLRKVITKDIERLQASPSVDVPGISLRIDELIDEIGQLPLLPGKPGTEPSAEKQPLEVSAWWKRFAVEAWSDFTQLVRVQNMEKPQLPLLAPDQAYYARENLKLRLLSARLALLARDEESYKHDLRSAQEWLKRYFDEKDKTVKSAATQLQQLSESPVRVDLPEISASLNAVRNFRLAPDRGGR